MWGIIEKSNGHSAPNPPENHRMFLRRRTSKDKASRSKFVAEANVGSLLYVDRLGSVSCDPAVMSMNESRHSSAARQRFTSIGRANVFGRWLSTDRIWLGIAPLLLGRGQTRAHRIRSSNAPYVSRLRPSFAKNLLPNALFPETAIKLPQGASPARLVSTAGEGPVLCFQSVRFHQSF